jgi:hypothetical protein
MSTSSSITRIFATPVLQHALRPTACRQAARPSCAGVRLLGALALVGFWNAASALHGSLVVTLLLTLGATALAVWAIVVLREE